MLGRDFFGDAWRDVAASSVVLGRLLEATWRLLPPSWVILGTSGAQVECLGRLLGPTWSLLGASGTPLGPSNRAPVVFHLYCPRGCQVQQYFIRSAPRAAKNSPRASKTRSSDAHDSSRSPQVQPRPENQGGALQKHRKIDKSSKNS